MVEERKEPAGPQDDKLLQLTEMLGQMQSHVSTIQGEDLAKRSGQRIELLNEVQKEVKEKCADIKDRVEEVRAIIARNLVNPKSLHGCLRGSVDDYLE